MPQNGEFKKLRRLLQGHFKVRNQDCNNPLSCCNINRDFHGFFNDLKNTNISPSLSK